MISEKQYKLFKQAILSRKEEALKRMENTNNERIKDYYEGIAMVTINLYELLESFEDINR